MSWNLLESSYGDIKGRRYEVAVLPLGATEPHNLHLPYGMDAIEGTMVGKMICEAAYERGAKVILLPTIPYGTETNLRQFPLAMNVNPSTLFAFITDLIESLVQSGIRKVVLLNSHGGNSLKPLLRELYGKSPAHIFLCNWYETIADKYSQIFEHPEDHAGEMETSFALAYCPELVARKADGSFNADPAATARFRLKALREGWASVTRPWHLLTTNSGAAYPFAATADKGRAMMQVVVQRLSEFLCELSETPIDETFPFDGPPGR
jgi:creatinine amidohydrolase